MRQTRRWLCRIAAALLFASSALFSAEPLGAASEHYSLIDVMVGGTYLKIDMTAATQARSSYQQALTSALRSKSTLVRIAARELEKRATCFAGR